MGDFVLGPIKVIDNGDGVYRAPVAKSKAVQDQVVDLQGNAVQPTGAEAQQALKSLGVSSLQGLRLLPASQYLEMMSQARSFAAQGDTLQTQDRLLQARLAAADAKLPFAESRAAGILKDSLEKELTLVVDRAKTAADSGLVLTLQDTFNAGREILSRLNVPLAQAKAQGYSFTQDLIDQLEIKAYAKAMPLVWKQAEADSQQGNVIGTQKLIAKVREYATRGQLTLTADEEKKLAELESKAYELSIDPSLTEAEYYALRGDVDQTRFYLRTAKEAASIAKIALSQKQLNRISQYKHTALRNAPDFLLPIAEADADLGEFETVRTLLEEAKDDRAQIGSSLNKAETARAEAAMQKAWRLSVDVLLGEAATALPEVKKTGYLTKINQLIAQARENAALAKTTFSAAQETSAVSLLRQAYQLAVDWRFRQASASADLGKVDDTEVPLNAGRELAKQGGVTFDETKASQLVDTALSNGIELEFTTAEKFATAGDATNTQFHLDLVRDYYRRLNKTFDSSRAAKILKLLPTP